MHLKIQAKRCMISRLQVYNIHHGLPVKTDVGWNEGSPLVRQYTVDQVWSTTGQ